MLRRRRPQRTGRTTPRIAGSGGVGSESERVETRVRLGDLELANPIVTASGTYGHGAEVARLDDASRLGAITAKSVSASPWAGKPAPRLHMTAAGMLNADRSSP